MRRKIHNERESTLKGYLMDRLRQYRGVVPFRIEDTATSGIPDMVVTARGRTTWWEVKYGDPSFDWGGLQHLQMRQLEEAGFARYIVYRQTADGQNQNVSIVHPEEMEHLERWETVNGFNHDWVIDWMLRQHKSWITGVR